MTPPKDDLEVTGERPVFWNDLKSVMYMYMCVYIGFPYF